MPQTNSNWLTNNVRRLLLLTGLFLCSLLLQVLITNNSIASLTFLLSTLKCPRQHITLTNWFISLLPADEVNTSSKGLGYYRSEDDSDHEANINTPMIMDSEIRSPQRDGLGLQNKRAYTQVFVFTQVVGSLLLLALLIWLFKYLGGIGFSTPGIIFNFHPLFMVIGFILLYSNC